ncbi:MAG: hypothetical protein M3Z08_07830 [Chloroflexota bacterium]|nr:hypothetical protein [Chloroflexota bacterium]
MNTLVLYGVASYDNEPEAEFFERHNECIKAAARKTIPRGFFREEEVDLEIDELEQRIRWKLLCVLRKKRPIENPRAYIYTVATTSAIDMIRCHKEVIPLPLDEYGELSQGCMQGAISEMLQDPAWICEINEGATERLAKVARVISRLPPSQRRAIICYLNERLDDVRPLVRMLRTLGCAVESVNWPAEKQEARNLKASVSIARKKVREQLEEAVIA